MALSTEQAAQYATIIDDILRSSDLKTISAKRVRKSLAVAVGRDITAQKDAITNLILVRFDAATAEIEAQTQPNGQASTFTSDDATKPAAPPPMPTTTVAPPSSAPVANGTIKHEHSTSPTPAPKRPAAAVTSSASSPLSSPAATPATDSTPPKKKHKKGHSNIEDDAELARRLQAEENSRSGRATRAGGSSALKKKVVKGKKRERAKKNTVKSAKRLRGSDDSELSDEEVKEVKRTGGFHKPMTLSPSLSALLDQTQLSRPQTVKKVWEYIKARDLQDPADKRQIRCDDAMRAVFKSDSVHMFTMNKILGQNLYALDE